MSLVNSLNEKFNFKNNLVVKIKDTYFAKYQPDSGLTVDGDKLIVSGATINPTQIDLKKATTQINSTTIDVLDGTAQDDFVFSAFIGSDPNALIGTEVETYFGRIEENMDFSQYLKIANYIISDISKTSGANFKIKAKSQEDKTQTPAFDQQGTLQFSISNLDLSAEVVMDEDIFNEFPSVGSVLINNEFIRYSGITFLEGVATFTFIARGDLLSQAEGHDSGDQVNFVQKLTGNPIDLILQLLISNQGGAGGVYDVLSDGAKIDESLIDIAAIEQLRDTFFPTDVFTLYAYEISNLIDYIEKELLVPNNVRLIKSSLSNLISLTILDQSDSSVDVPEIDDSITVINSPRWKVSKNDLQTVVKVQWNYVEGLKRFTRSRTFKANQDILDAFGEIKGPTLSFKGVQESDNGSSIVADRASRFLQRFSTPRASVQLAGFMKTFQYNVGDKIRVTAKNLPQEGGALGMSSILELVNRAVNTSTGIVKMGFRFTSYSNIRSGLISPSPFVDSVIDQKTFNVAAPNLIKKGYALRLWDYVGNRYHSDPVNIVADVIGETIIMENEWQTTLTTNEVLFFADYPDCNEEQIAKFAFVVDNTDFFADGSKGYQVII